MCHEGHDVKSVIKVFGWGGGFPAHNNNINLNLYYYYADFRTPNCLMTFVTHDTRDLRSCFFSVFFRFIREPQWECSIFAPWFNHNA